uniref:Uncharacterized protein n=1 Tax=Cacopsylla melanoneura TaxID=428564 RepID=A0A8D8UD01_9HEMI
MGSAIFSLGIALSPIMKNNITILEFRANKHTYILYQDKCLVQRTFILNSADFISFGLECLSYEVVTYVCIMNYGTTRFIIIITHLLSTFFFFFRQLYCCQI